MLNKLREAVSKRRTSRVSRTIKGLMVLLIVFSFLFATLIGYAYDKTYTAYVVGNAHIDTAWLWQMPETVDVVNKTFSSQLKLMDKNPEYKYIQSASVYYQWSKEYFPDMFNDIKKKVANGQWEIAGGQVVEPDLNITGGESLIRQSMYGQRYFRDEFGMTTKVGYGPDIFGFTYAFPQILKKSGIDYFVTTKLNWNDTNPFPYNLFKWKGVDGSQLVVYKPHYDYVLIPKDNDITLSLTKPAALGIKNSLILYGTGDHGGGPTQANLDGLYNQDAKSTLPNVKMKKAIDYFTDISANTEKLPVWNDEMYLETHRGTYTSQAAMKKYNRTSEIAAEEAEKFSSMANWLGTGTYPYEKITKAWNKININQFHDILPGSSIRGVYDDAWDDSEVALNYLNSSMNNALAGISSRADTTGGGIQLVVFNPLSWERSSLVETEVSFPSVPDSVHVYDPSGTELPVQVLSINGTVAKIAFEANKVPSMGYKVFRAEQGTKKEYNTGLSIGGNVIENSRFKLEINPKTGNLSRIYDKLNKKEVLSGGEGNVLQVYENDVPKIYDAWNMDMEDFAASVIPTEINTAASIRIVEAGPVKAVYRVTKNWSKSTFVQDIVLYKDIDRVDIKMSVEWKESHKLLKVAFPLSVNPPKATYEIAYGAIERPTTRSNPVDAAKFEVSGHKWADLSEKDYGVSILNDCKYGWDALGNRLRLTLLKSAKDPDPNADMGHHEFTYSIYPHNGDWKSSNTVRKGYELNYPLLTQQTNSHSGTLGKSFSFMSIDQPNVVVSVAKKAEDSGSDDMIIRIYETQGKDKTTAKITFAGNIASASEVNLLEDFIGKAEFNSNKLSADLEKYEIKTFRVKLDKPYYSNTKPTFVKVGLGSEYNLDGMSYDSARSDGDLDGSKGTFSADLMPDEVISEDVAFDIGPKKNGSKNIVQANGQTIQLPSEKGKCLYILGTAAGSSPSRGTFTVNYNDSATTTKDLTFRSWVSLIGGWNKPVAKEPLGYFLSHNHTSLTDNYVKDNYLYIYRIGLDASKTLKSITLPNAGGIKILAISVVKDSFLPNPDEKAPSQVTGLTAAAASLFGDTVALGWKASTDNIRIEHYNVYRDTKNDFLPDSTNQIGETKETSYIDTVDSHNTFYYKIAAEDSEGNIGKPSLQQWAVTGVDNLALGKTATADGNVSGETPKKAIDGILTGNSKWCVVGAGDHWLKVDLGKSYDINKFAIKHAGAGGENPGWNTRDFRIETSDDGSTWTTRVDVTGNAENITTHNIKTINARYARLYITKQTNNTDIAARIYEFEIFGMENMPASDTMRFMKTDKGPYFNQWWMFWIPFKLN